MRRGITTWTVPAQITLPDGTSYSFTYEQNKYGEPSTITLPTGGQISYTWVGPHDDAGRRVATRTLTEGGQSFYHNL